MISVIVPVYNAEKTLRQCVDSILGQDYRDFELLLIDDGSKDSSSAICDEYARQDERVQVFHKPNGGVSSARNLGLDNVRGEWITFIDSDDYITERYFNDVSGSGEDLLIRGYKNERNGQLNEDFSISSIQLNLPFQKLICDYLASPILRGPVYKFYRHRLLRGLKFVENMKIGEDAQFVFRYLANCQSYKLLPGGEYVIRISGEPDDVKYAISVEYAVLSLTYLKEAFEEILQVHHIDKSKFLPYIGYFKRITKSDWLHDRSRWYGNMMIRDLYKYVWPDLPLLLKFRIIIASFLEK